MNKQEAITQVQDCISSVFSKEDVIKLIEQIKDGDSMSVLKAKEFTELITYKFKSRLERISDDLIDYGSAEFTIEHDNRLELNEVGLHLDDITDELETIVEMAISETFDVVEEDIEENVVSC